MTNEDRANEMRFYFTEKLEIISALMPMPNAENRYDPRSYKIRTIMLRKQLLYSLLDAVSMVRALVLDDFHLRKSGRQWMEFLTDDCEWKESHRVSVPVLARKFEIRAADGRKGGSPEFVEYLRNIERAHPDRGRDVRSSVIDPYVSNLLPRATTETEMALIKKSTLVELLYEERCFYTHQMRELGEGVVGFAHITDEPVYQGINDDGRLHLVFPEQFVAARVRAGIDSFHRIVTWRDVDPYSFLRDNNAWELFDWTPKKVWPR